MAKTLGISRSALQRWIALLPHTQPFQPMIRSETARKGNTMSYHKQLHPSKTNQKTLNGF
jgi:hypothetical protein